MLQLGLTGGIGSGKSTVSKFLTELGCIVYNSDDRAKWLMSNNHELKKEILQLFGSQSFINNKLNRKFLSEIVFNDNTSLKKLNNLVHPLVAKDYQNFISNHSDSNLIVKEAAILIESGAYKEMDLILLIISDQELRINRVLKRDKSNPNGIYQRINKQMKDTDKRQYADYIITNNGSKLDLKEKVYDFYNKIKLTFK
tara:strand:- start:6099 stop:6692 length:594 start_codon:yes stop_codon:yes gene_type:complete